MKISHQVIFYVVKFIQALANNQVPLLSSLSSGFQNAPSISNAIINAPHIFNTIHGAMRQWDNSLKHNGMSYYPVSVAENTLFYHGDVSNVSLTGVQWLAFEVEHAEFFFKALPPFINRGTLYYLGHVGEQNYTGYLSTFRTTRPLNNVLYLDGTSAAKSRFGTLDTQDRVLLENNDFRSRPGVIDDNRAIELCKLFPHLDGIIRMELGFELILCDLGSNVERLSFTSHPQVYFPNKTESIFFMGEYTRGVSKRYSGIGASKVSVDYSSMLSAYFYPFNLTNTDPDKTDVPRINPEEKELVQKLKNDVINLFKNYKKPQESIDWQSIVDEVVIRYSDRLAYMEGMVSNKFEMLRETDYLLDRFINRTAPNLTASEEFCTSVYLLPASITSTATSTDEFIHEAVMTVSRRICRVLFEAYVMLRSRQDQAVTEEVRYKIRDLMNWLNWSRWKECGRCGWDEVCAAAIWPLGSSEDHDHPQCRKIDQWRVSLDYWDVDFGKNFSRGRAREH